MRYRYRNKHEHEHNAKGRYANTMSTNHDLNPRIGVTSANDNGTATNITLGEQMVRQLIGSEPRLVEPQGKKYDTGKVQMELLSVPAMTAIAEVLTFGAKKYDAHNWRKGFKWSRLFGAMLRHTFAAMSGEDRDPESGLLHLAHAGCCIMFLLEHAICGLGQDDRYIVDGNNNKG
jgi:hypothetical protein